ncbi:MAG: tetratricopeptide repeat protein [Bryobacteraceae bacterium]
MGRSKLRLMQRDYSGALLGFEDSLSVVERNCGPDGFEAGLILLDIGGADHLLQRNTAAERSYRRALTIFDKGGSRGIESGAIARIFLAKLLMLDRRMTEAEALFEQAITVLQSSGNQDRAYLAGARINLAEAYRTDGRYAKAEPLYRSVLDMVQGQPSLRTPDITLGLAQFPSMLHKMKRKAEARAFRQQIQPLLSE